MNSKLLYGEEETVNGDSSCIGVEKREDTILKNKHGNKIRCNINLQTHPYMRRIPSDPKHRPSAENRKNLGTSENGICIFCREGTSVIPKNEVSKVCQTHSQNEYDGCSGESDSGSQTYLLGGLSWNAIVKEV